MQPPITFLHLSSTADAASSTTLVREVHPRHLRLKATVEGRDSEGANAQSPGRCKSSRVTHQLLLEMLIGDQDQTMG